jgi:hypothetical protein
MTYTQYGTSVSPHCPHFPTETKTHAHALLACPHNTVAAHRIVYDLNHTIRTTTYTLFRRGTQDAAHLRAYLTSQSTPPYKLVAGWTTSYKDAHGRIFKTGKGPDRVTNIDGSRTLHPSLFRYRIRPLMSSNNRPPNTLTRAEADTAFTPTRGQSIDVHCIRMLHQSLPIQRLYCNV